MNDIIQRHNRLNGVAFSIVEFGVVAVLSGTFATYYLLNYRAVMAFISWGITLNCVPVVVYGIRQLAHDRATGVRTGSFWNKRTRNQRKRENPHMFRDTVLLTVGTLLPFVSLAAVLFDVFRPPKP